MQVGRLLAPLLTLLVLAACSQGATPRPATSLSGDQGTPASSASGAVLHAQDFVQIDGLAVTNGNRTANAGDSIVLPVYLTPNNVLGNGQDPNDPVNGCNATPNNQVTVKFAIDSLTGTSTSFLTLPTDALLTGCFVNSGTASFIVNKTIVVAANAQTGWSAKVKLTATGGKTSGSGQKIDNPVDQSYFFTVTVLAPTPKPTVVPEIIAGTLNATSGWYTDNVTMRWNISGGTGDAGCNTITLATDTTAAGQNFTCTATGAGGSTSVTQNLKRDATSPVITPGDIINAAWRNAPLTGTFTASDSASGLTPHQGLDANSQLALTASAQSANATTPTVVSKTVTDVAGNATTRTVSALIDLTKPTISAATYASDGTTAISPNANGWFNQTVVVKFTCADTLSGVIASGAGACPAPVTLATDTPATGQTVSGSVTDNAGNVSTPASVTVKVDKTAPTISAATFSTTDTPISANAAGWFKQDVVVKFTCADGGASVTCPANVTVNGDTPVAGQTVSGSVTDAAGNSASTSVLIKVDKTAPAAHLAATGTLGQNSWYTGNVTFSSAGSTDALSGLVACSAVSPLTTDTDGITVTTTCTDAAGNSDSASLTVKRDTAAPTISAAADRPANGAGWYSANVTVTFTCSDGAHSVSCPAPVIISGNTASQLVSGTATDEAGNQALAAITIKLDKTAPTATLTPSPAAPNGSNGWYISPISFTAAGTDDLSGGVTCTPVAGISTDTTGTPVSTTCTDAAGNTATSADLTVKLDQTKPTITAAADRAPNGNDWYNANVTVTFSCSDATSGIAGACPTAQVFTTDGNHSASASVTDQAGNTATSNVVQVHLDTTAPVISGADLVDATWRNTDLSATFTATDALSGLANTSDSPFTLTASDESVDATHPTIDTQTVLDKAGNAATRTLSAKIDKTAPVIVGPDYTETAWRNTALVKSFTASDALSGLATPADASFDLTASAESVDATHPTTATQTVKDVAGNATTRTIGALIDKTKPVADIQAAGTMGLNGWYTSTVTFSTTGSTDALSGLAACTVPAALTADTTSFLATTTCTDRAGNTDDATVTVKRDATRPVIHATADRAPNAAGWYNAAVTVSYGCTDATPGAGIAPGACPSAVAVTSDTPLAGQTVSDTVTDQAGNESLPDSVTIKLDKTAPTVTPGNVTSTVWRNTPLTQAFAASDALSGLAQDSDATFNLAATAQSVDSTTPTVVSKTVTDVAGNATTRTVSALIDLTQPTISAATFAADGITPLSPNANGWFNQTVVVKFTCADALSGIHPGDCPDPITVSADTAGQAISETVSDAAGNVSAAATLTVKLDKTAPTASITPSPSVPSGLNGWYTGKVSFTTSGTDGLSGGVTCRAIPTLADDTSGATVTTTCVDLAGNTRNASLNIKMDKTFPVVTTSANLTVNATSNSQASVVFAAPTATDNFTNPIAASCDKVSPLLAPVGTTTVTCTATDAAGNKTDKSFTVTVNYAFTGFFQPIDMSTGSTIVYNTVKVGSAVPVKFKLGGNQGLNIFASGSPTALPVNCATNAVADAIEELSAATVSGLQYDATAGQYVYVWKTSSAYKVGSCYQLNVRFLDNTVQTAFFQFK